MRRSNSTDQYICRSEHCDIMGCQRTLSQCQRLCRSRLGKDCIQVPIHWKRSRSLHNLTVQDIGWPHSTMVHPVTPGRCQSGAFTHRTQYWAQIFLPRSVGLPDCPLSLPVSHPPLLSISITSLDINIY